MNVAGRRILFALSILALLMLGGWLLMPKPISTDLSQVGQGRPAVVLAYENFSPTGGEALARLNNLRGEYEGRMVFALADLGTPQGRAFANRYALHDGLAVILTADGKVHSSGVVPVDPQALRARLDGVLVSATSRS
jgi:hypothetical protein